jgi:hypothetical protein
MYLSQAQVDTAGAIVSADPSDASNPIETITVTASKPNPWPWIIAVVLAVGLAWYWMSRREGRG